MLAPREAPDLRADVAVGILGAARAVDLDDAPLVDRDVQGAAIRAIERTDGRPDFHAAHYTASAEETNCLVLPRGETIQVVFSTPRLAVPRLLPQLLEALLQLLD